MLREASTFNGYAIEASDGPIGTVSDLLFEDVGWAVRWLVVDTGAWRSGRKVLLPRSALGQFDKTLRCLPVKLTAQQVKNSPAVDTNQPVSRQIETQVYNHYGWVPHWAGNFNMSAIATPFVVPLWSAPHDALSNRAKPGEGNPYLRSVAALIGYHVYAYDGHIGHADDFLLDDASWNIRYIVVDTRTWRHGENVLVSSRSVCEIDWTNRMIHLDVEREKIKAGPSYDPAVVIDRAYEENFLEYYGMRWGMDERP